MILLMVPATISFLIKAFILWVARETLSLKQPTILVGLVAIAMLHNITEVVGFSLLVQGENPEYLFRIYYVLTLALLGYVSAYALKVSNLNLPLARPIYLAAGGIVSVLLLIPGPVIDGYHNIGYSVTANRGDFYWMFQLLVLFFLISTIVYLILGYRRSSEAETKIGCIYTLLAFFPLVLVCGGVIALMAAGIKINATVVIPIATTLFIIITVATEARHRSTDIRRYLPWSREWQLVRKLLATVSDFSLGKIPLKNAVEQAEALMIAYKLNQHNGNVSTAAADMGMPRATLYHKLKKAGIEIKRVNKVENGSSLAETEKAKVINSSV